MKNPIKINKNYITFEQAKFLVDKGFNYHDIFEDFADYYDHNIPNGHNRIHNSDFPMDNYPDISVWIPIPQQWQVVDYLRIKYNIWISVQQDWYDGEFLGYKAEIQEFDGVTTTKTFDTPQEAYSEAFDCIIKNNLIKY